MLANVEKYRPNNGTKVQTFKKFEYSFVLFIKNRSKFMIN